MTEANTREKIAAIIAPTLKPTYHRVAMDLALAQADAILALPALRKERDALEAQLDACRAALRLFMDAEMGEDWTVTPDYNAAWIKARTALAEGNT